MGGMCVQLPRVFVNGVYLGGQPEVEKLAENYELQVRVC